MDTTPPTSSVSALPSQTTTTSFVLSVTGIDPNGAGNSSTLGPRLVRDLRIRGRGSYSPFATVTPASPKAPFTGQAGHTYAFYSLATDNAGNVQPIPTSAQTTVQILPPLTISPIAVSPDVRNTAVSSLYVSPSLSSGLLVIGDNALTLTDNGGPNLINAGVTVTPITASDYLIGGLEGLTSAEGNFTLTVNAADITDPYGNPGTGTVSTSWLMDTTPPTSTVNALPQTTTSTTFTVSVTGSDPIASNGSPPSGIKSIVLFVSDDGGPFTSFATVTPADPSAQFTGQFGYQYGFYSVATDNAGNVQATPTSAQATTQVASPLSVTSIAAVSPAPVSRPSPRSTSPSVSQSIPAASPRGALTLTDDGGPNLINGGVSLSLVSGTTTTYAIGGLAGLTAAQGQYTLTVNAADIQDPYGDHGTGSIIHLVADGHHGALQPRRQRARHQPDFRHFPGLGHFQRPRRHRRRAGLGGRVGVAVRFDQ